MRTMRALLALVLFGGAVACAAEPLPSPLGRVDGLVVEHYNPFPYPDGLFDGAADGADFTVGAVHRGGSWGNFFGGQIGGLAIFKRALSEAEMQVLARAVPLSGKPATP